MQQNEIFNFAGKVAFITGASSGIGRSTAMEFAKHGANVAAIDVNTDEGGRTAYLINEKGGKAIFINCDVSKATDVKRAVEETVNKFGRLDFAFNNAGIEDAPAFTADYSEENWDRVLSINLKGVWLCMKYQIPQMLRQGGGSIVNCSSIAGLVGFANMPAYVASKHGVLGLTKVAALDYAKLNIRVNAICPGVIQTPMVDRFVKGNNEAKNQLTSGEPIGRVGQPEEIAAAALWLSSSQSSFVTGHSMVVDGGWVAQ
jgi:NAD(P)-dependent dehydrogenase (short-subunit alcohol dehydrogenase family)